MTKKNVEIRLDLEDRDAQRNLKKLSKGAKDLADDFDDTESAGKQMARAIERSADSMIDEIDDTKRAVDRMATALDGTDMDPTKVVRDLKRVGLTAQDIEDDADDLAAALKRAGDVETHATANGFQDVGDAVGSVDEQTGRARDSMVGFTGGAIGELPLVGEALGPVGEGLGQLTEGFLEGEVNVKQFVAAGATMAGVGLVVQGLSGAWTAHQEAQQAAQERIENATAALIEQSDAVNDLEAAIEGLEEKAVPADGLVEALLGDLEDDQVANLNASLADLGLTYDDLFNEIRTNGDDLTAIYRRQLEGVEGLSESAVNKLVTIISTADDTEVAIQRLAGSDVQFASFLNDLDTGKFPGLRPLIADLAELDDSVNETDFAAVMDGYFNQIIVSGGPASAALEAIRAAHPDASDLQVYTMLDERLATMGQSFEDAATAAQHGSVWHELSTDLDGVGDSAADTSDDVDEVTRSLSEMRDEQLAQVDPIFATMKATEDHAAALEALNAEGGDTPENLRDVVRAAADLESAMLDAATQADATGDDLYQMGLDAGLTEQQAFDLAVQIALTEDAADEFADEYVADLLANDDATTSIDEVKRAAEDLDGTVANVRVRVTQEGQVILPGGQRAMDRGGFIPSNETALIAEKRPEIFNGALVTSPTVVSGPGRVTSGQATASQLAGSPLPPPVGAPVSPTVVNNNMTIIAPGIRTAREADDLIRRQKRRTGR